MKESPSPISEFLKHLNYDPVTGHLWWKIRGQHRMMDRPAGSITGKGYRDVKLFNKSYRANRVIWAMVTGAWPKYQVDHKNLNKDDNRWDNLREATNAENGRNRSKLRNNSKSELKGVSWHKHIKKWCASIRVDRKLIHLGYFNTPEEAHASYKVAAIELHGEFYRVG